MESGGGNMSMGTGASYKEYQAKMDSIKERQNRGRRQGQVGRAVKQAQNTAPAERQITAEQILREAHERRDIEAVPPRQQITDPEELAHYKLTKRKEFEDVIRRSRHSVGAWFKYARWEERQEEYERSRSIYERVLDVDYKNPSTWLRYAEMEMKAKFVNHARNVWDRAVQLLPRVDQLWYKYAFMEEQLGNLGGARSIFERWMKWKPEEKAWMTYINFEMRLPGPKQHKLERARAIYERFVVAHPDMVGYLRYAKWEERNGEVARARGVYQRIGAELGEEANTPKYFMSFAQLEVDAKETERARVIYQYALDNVPKHLAEGLYSKYTAFEKQFGDKSSVDTVILSKKRFQFEEELKEASHNYDIWFDYTKLEESNGDVERVREVYERAVASIPPIQEKRYWQRYIYLWIRYALFEELVAEDMERARKVYTACIDTIPHKKFTFAKIWLLFAYFELRQSNLEGARKLLGQSLGMCPKPRLFKGYIEMELKLAAIDRCRKLYEKFLEYVPENCYAWTKYAEMERDLGEHERARALFELAIQQPVLDMPEVLWKSYIDFETGLGEVDRVRKLYARLLERTKHVKIWISRAQFEVQHATVATARTVFQEADEHFRDRMEQGKDERVLLLDAWQDFERQHGNGKTREAVDKKMPRKIKKQRLLKDEQGSDAGWEEYYDYIFPDAKGQAASNLKILEAARMWKKRKTETSAS